MKHIILEIIALLVSSFITSIVFWIVTPDKMIEAKIIIPILILVLILLYGTVKYIFLLQDELKNNNQIRLPKLKTIEEDSYIFESSEIFEQQSYCIIYKIDKTKRKIATGVVEAVLDSTHLIQVRLFQNIEDSLKTELLKQKDNIYLKPTITTNEIAEELIQTGDSNE